MLKKEGVWSGVRGEMNLNCSVLLRTIRLEQRWTQDNVKIRRKYRF
jgi:hypothetical protein